MFIYKNCRSVHQMKYKFGLLEVRIIEILLWCLNEIYTVHFTAKIFGVFSIFSVDCCIPRGPFFPESCGENNQVGFISVQYHDFWVDNCKTNLPCCVNLIFCRQLDNFQPLHTCILKESLDQ